VLRKKQYLAFSERLDGYVAEETRVTVLRTVLVIGLLIAGFNAWDEQYQVARKVALAPKESAGEVSITFAELSNKSVQNGARYWCTDCDGASMFPPLACTASGNHAGAEAVGRKAQWICEGP